MDNLKRSISFILGLVAKDRKLRVLLPLEAVLKNVQSIIFILAPKYLLDSIIRAHDLKEVLLILILVCGSYFICGYSLLWVDNLLRKSKQLLSDQLSIQLNSYAASIDYDQLSASTVQDDLLLARNLIMQGTFTAMVSDFFSLISNFISLIWITWILFLLPWYISVVIVGLVALNSVLHAKAQNETHSFMLKTRNISRKVDYVSNLLSNYVYGKEVRVNQLSDFLMGKFKSLRSQFFSQRHALAFSYLGSGIVAACSFCFQRVAVLNVLIFQYYNAGLGFGDISSLLVATEQYSSVLTSSLEIIKRIKLGLSDLTIIQRILHDEQRRQTDRQPQNRCPEAIERIEFDHVSFVYPGKSEYVFRNFSISLTAGKKYAVVGLNGSGKSTFVKLLLRISKPSEGTIKLNGIDIQSIPLTEYRRCITAVFQDFALFSLSVRDNLVMSTASEYDGKLDTVFSKMGIDSIIQKLPCGIDTFLNRDYDRSGVSFSKGEQQKLAIARALLRDTGILIMDEPTSALSPLAEAEVYGMINSLVSTDLMIFVSHRLASTQFCDEILVFDNGSVRETGSHQELMRLNGEYARLYTAQAETFKN